MTPEQWRRARAVFDEAVERPEADRSTFLDATCHEDPSLRAVVDSLLQADEANPGALEAPAWPLDAEAPPETLVGLRLGPYELVERVGEGGMGVVYRAVRADDTFRREVAVKLVRSGADSALVVERFRQEREILAGLDHPNIARLLDAGRSSDGRPYVVMDFVQGEPLDAYCRRRRLDVRARLALFEAICSAVAYAHQNLIVHRDLKPANILIDRDGVPKLLDFGIAKLLSAVPGRDATATGLLLATPEYASPEQLRGERIGAASDVYSLGVLLYELLADAKPYGLEGHPLPEVLRIVCEVEPMRPSAVPGLPSDRRRALAGDLDNIVLLALRKEPQLRYASVEQLAEDVRRHLQSRPVRARPATLRYRTGRLLRRNPLAAGLVVMLVAWVGIATHQAVVARRERALAQRRFEDVRRLANTFLFEFHDAIRDLPGATPARELAVERGLQYLAILAEESQSDPALRLELGLAYKRIGDIQYQVGVVSRGQSTQALDSFARAAPLLAEHAAAGAGPPRAVAALAELRFVEGGILRGRGDVAAGLARYEEAERLQQALVARDASARTPRRALSDVHRQTARALAQAGRLSDALRQHEKAVATAQALVASPEAESADRQVLQRALRDEAEALRQSGDIEGALDRLARCEPVVQERLAREPDSPAARKALATLAIRTGDVWMRAGDPLRAVAQFQRALAVYRALSGQDPADGVSRDDVALTSTRLCEALIDLGRPGDARPFCREALEIGLSRWRAEPSDEYAWGTAMGHEWMGQLHLSLREWRPARTHISEFVRLVEDVRSRNPSADYDHALAEGHASMARLEASEGRGAAARASYEKAAALYRALAAADQADFETRLTLAQTLASWAETEPAPQGCGPAREAAGLLDALEKRHPLPRPGLAVRGELARLVRACPSARP